MEEFIGELWHKTATRFARSENLPYSAHLSDIERAAPIFFRALGGDAGTQISAFLDKQQRGSRRFWQVVAGTNHDLVDALTGEDGLLLPPSVYCFNSTELNRDLYWWWLASAPHFIRANGDWASRNHRATQITLQQYPGLRSRYQHLLAAHLKQRRHHTHLAQQSDENLVSEWLQASDNAPTKPLHYRDDRLPIVLWFRESNTQRSARRNAQEKEHHDQKDLQQKDASQQKRRGETAQESDKRSPIMVFFRAESILSWAENLNINRSTDDEDEDNLSTADDLNSIAVSEDTQSRKSRIKFDLDLPAAIDDDIALSGGWTVPEWDYKKQALFANACRIVPMQSVRQSGEVNHDRLFHVSRKLKRQFQALTPKNEILHRQSDGDEIELDELLRFIADRRHGVVDGSHLYRSVKKQQRDLSCVLLADLSRSTETHINNEQRVIDVIKDALHLFGDALHACRDPFEMHGFYSLRRDPIRLYTLKHFDESFGNTVHERINALHPGYYTRVGAAIRAVSERLQQRPTRQKLLLLLSDGKPNDMDHYEGRFGVEDTRHAVMQARQQGITPFCITIDEKASAYLPYMFGQQNFVVVRKPEQLPQALLQVYRLLTR